MSLHNASLQLGHFWTASADELLDSASACLLLNCLSVSFFLLLPLSFLYSCNWNSYLPAVRCSEGFMLEIARNRSSVGDERNKRKKAKRTEQEPSSWWIRETIERMETSEKTRNCLDSFEEAVNTLKDLISTLFRLKKFFFVDKFIFKML